MSQTPTNIISAGSQCVNRPVSQKMAAVSKVDSSHNYEVYGKGSIKNLIRLATSQK